MDAKPVAGAGFRWRWVAFLIGQRLAFGILVLLAIIFLSHMGLYLARGRSVALALADAATGSVAYLDRLALGDLGLSQAGSITALPAPVVEAVPRTLPKSLGLLGVSLFIATLTGVGLGIWAAGLRHTGWAVPILLASIAGTSLPSFFVARLLQMGVLQWARTFSFRLLPVGGFGWDQHIILPALVLAARPVAQIARVTYVSVGELLEQDFVRTAQGKGLWPRLILLRHIIPNAAIPILTTVSLTIRFSLSSLPVVEFFFGWPGVGYTLLKAISRGDDNLTVALALCLGILFILINLILEVSYRLLDPRLQDGPSSGPRGEREGPLQFGRSLLADLWDWVSHIRLPGRPTFLRARVRSSPSSGSVVPEEAIEYRTFPSWFVAWRIRLCRILRNLPLVAGSTLTVLLLILFVWGPRLAPHSPYTTQGLVSVEGALTAPPFEPSNTHPWGTDVIGRDMMSLVLAGAQQTLLLATLVVMARLVVGVLLGATAGWLSGSWLDRLLLRSVEIIAAFPALLLAMMLILALGIRQGLRPFVLGLCLVGWGEIMQFVRGQVIALRAQPFIESAVATGLRTPRIILHHILPNLMSGMISVVALEMGAVLMLLGELGFVGIFLGGGAFAETAWLGPVYHYSDVPEWGALLSNVRAYGRSYPWLAFYPSLAFFIAILTFNLFGEGVRRAVESARTEIIRLLGRYILPLLVVMTGLGIVWGRGNMGAVSTYRQQAAAFDGARALTHVRALADGALQGRALGSPGMDSAADYIAQQFEALGLQAAGEGTSYFQTRSRSYQSLDAIPQLIIEDGGPALRYRQDYGVRWQEPHPRSNPGKGAISGHGRVILQGGMGFSPGAGQQRLYGPDPDCPLHARSGPPGAGALRRPAGDR